MKGGYSVSGYQTCIMYKFTHSTSFVLMGRSGRPSYSDPWVDQVNWLAGTLMVLYVVIGV